jgi:NAD(P)-dependent dehydrogenase (short-subunit alcohol dehydrogenase family)
MTKQPWALILGASSGFGEAAALELARAGMNIFGLYNRRDHIDNVEAMGNKIRGYGRQAFFVNDNATMEDTRMSCMGELGQRTGGDPPGTLRVILHSLAFAGFRAMAGAEEVVTRAQLELTEDVMGNSLVYWVQDCLRAGLLDRGARIFAMTGIGGSRVFAQQGAVSAAQAALEAHVRQLAVELAPAGITVNGIMPGVADTQSLRQMPGFEKILDTARHRNPSKRLTLPEDVARSIAALCHPATYWLTGNILHIDGGENIVA